MNKIDNNTILDKYKEISKLNIEEKKKYILNIILVIVVYLIVK